MISGYQSYGRPAHLLFTKMGYSTFMKSAHKHLSCLWIHPLCSVDEWNNKTRTEPLTLEKGFEQTVIILKGSVNFSVHELQVRRSIFALASLLVLRVCLWKTNCHSVAREHEEELDNIIIKIHEGKMSLSLLLWSKNQNIFPTEEGVGAGAWHQVWKLLVRRFFSWSFYAA